MQISLQRPPKVSPDNDKLNRGKRLPFIDVLQAIVDPFAALPVAHFLAPLCAVIPFQNRQVTEPLDGSNPRR